MRIGPPICHELVRFAKKGSTEEDGKENLQVGINETETEYVC